jgi:dihydroflavonol-4-reductase
MRTLVTGSTGTVGGAIVQQLLDSGREVRALVRDVARARAILPAAVELVPGDTTDAASVKAAVAGCGAVFHTAGLPEQWLRDPGRFTEVNVGGSINMGEAALAAGVQAFVYTSTIDVLEWKHGRDGKGELFDESTIATAPKGSYYERSKQEADRAMVALQGRGLPVRYAHPAAVFGDAPALTPGLNDLLVRVLKGKVPMILPGGIPVVLTDDVARGHLALEQAPVGARAIFSERFVSLVELAKELVRAAGRGKVPRVLPVWIAKLVSVAGEGLAKVTRRAPLIPAGQLQFLLEDVHPSAERAKRELGWTPVPFPEAMDRAVAAFRARGWVDG